MVEFALGAPLDQGLIRARPEDFRVEEVIGYSPSGDGEHLWLEVEKRGRNTVDVAGELALRAGVPVRAVGFAGLKDRNALTRQPFTIHLAGQPDPPWRDWQIEGVRILEAHRHHRKIQRGRLTGNRFELVIRELSGDHVRIESRLRQIQALGVPNRFGEQRFGGNNIARAHRLFRGELRRQPGKAKRGFYLSAARSLIFNRVLDERIRRGDWNRAIDGDVVMLDGSRSHFLIEDPGDADIQRRIAELDLHPSGPLVGEGPLPTKGEAAAIERRVIEAEHELAEGLAKFRLKQERRALRMRVNRMQWAFDDHQPVMRLSFELRSGCYATTVLAELLDYRIVDPA
ncbi:MAG: tRNA pseudouridine(13) synthase TruD [Wenzhouxiangellaceae bacterium]